MRTVQVGLTVCLAAAMGMLGCDSGAEQDDAGTETESAAISCGDVGTSAWVNQTIPQQTGKFQIAFSVMPTGPNIDAVVGLTNGPATKWSSLAAIVRFNPKGFIDARAGSEYKADAVVDYSYAYNHYLNFRMDIDVTRHVYSVWVQFDAGTNWTLLAREYPFRSEQASITRLNNVAAFVNPETSPAGSTIGLCGFDITTTPAPEANCKATVAGGGFANQSITASADALFVNTNGTPRAAFIDGVIGVANGDVDAYNDLAASVRFWTNGKIEARDGDVYRADVDVNYLPNQQYNFTFVIDRRSHTYSVWVWGDFDPVVLANNYKFRPQQAGVPQLDRVASVIASPSGRLDVCGASNSASSAVRTAITGVYQVIPQADDGALISDATRTQRLAPDGSITAAVPVGGSIAQDTFGNVYIARVTNGTLAVDSYTPALQLRWSRSLGNGYADTQVRTGSGASSGGAHFVLLRIDAQNTWYFDRMLNVTADGTANVQWTDLGDHQALGPDRYVTADRADNWIFTARTYSGTVLWQRSFPLTFEVGAMAIGPDGALAFGGSHSFGTNFGDGELPVYPTPDGAQDAYVAVFNADGTTRFSDRFTGSYVTGVAFTRTKIALSVDHWTQFPYAALAQYDTAGNGGAGDFDVGFGQNGRTYGIAIGPTGRIWFGLSAPTPASVWTMNPVLIGFK